MNNITKIIIAVVAIAIIAVGAVLLAGDNKSKQNTDTSSSSSNKNSEPTGDAALVINYDSNGFSPADSTVKTGDKIKIVNGSQKELDFASNVHPVHTDNSELNVGEIAPGESKTFTITTNGIWHFHNHYDATKGGTITVK